MAFASQLHSGACNLLAVAHQLRERRGSVNLLSRVATPRGDADRVETTERSQTVAVGLLLRRM